MVQYAEIKEVSDIISGLNDKWVLSLSDKQLIVEHLTKYKDILEGWYGDEQYHNKVEEGIEL